MRSTLNSLVRRVLNDFVQHAAPVFLSESNAAIRIAGHVARMRRAEFKICAYLISHGGRWIPERELLQNVLQMHHDRETSLIRVHVRRIRQALGVYQGSVQSKRLAGYRFVVPATESINP